MRRVIFNQKGGVGKTSVSCNLAATFSKLGKKVLLIDLDPQANSSQYLLGKEYEKTGASIADFFSSTLGFKIFKDNLKETMQSTPYEGLSIIPASGELTELQQKLEARYKILKLKQSLDELLKTKHFDEIIIDTPPALNFYTMSAFIACDKVLIPFDCDAFSAKALFQVVELVEEVAHDHQPNLSVEGIVINHFQASAKLPYETIQSLLAKGFKVFNPYLSSSIIMKESHEKSIPLVYLRPQHKLSLEYVELAKNLAKKQANVAAAPSRGKIKTDTIQV
jgi:chromosome partitioning protein